jgi:hypothetical protein
MHFARRDHCSPTAATRQRVGGAQILRLKLQRLAQMRDRLAIAMKRREHLTQAQLRIEPRDQRNNRDDEQRDPRLKQPRNGAGRAARSGETVISERGVVVMRETRSREPVDNLRESCRPRNRELVRVAPVDRLRDREGESPAAVALQCHCARARAPKVTRASYLRKRQRYGFCLGIDFVSSVCGHR